MHSTKSLILVTFAASLAALGACKTDDGGSDPAASVAPGPVPATIDDLPSEVSPPSV